MKNMIAGLVTLFVVSATAQTVILFDDGLQYTLDPNEKVYVTTGAQGGVGTPEWCETYIPWSEGLTFDMITWQRQCDVTNDGVYDMCDYYQPTGILSFEELEWQDRCNDGMPWDGS